MPKKVATTPYEAWLAKLKVGDEVVLRFGGHLHAIQRVFAKVTWVTPAFVEVDAKRFHRKPGRRAGLPVGDGPGLEAPTDDIREWMQREAFVKDMASAAETIHESLSGGWHSNRPQLGDIEIGKLEILTKTVRGIEQCVTAALKKP